MPSGLNAAQVQECPVGTILRRTSPRSRGAYLVDHGYVHGLEDEKVLVATRAYGCVITFSEWPDSLTEFEILYTPDESEPQ